MNTEDRNTYRLLALLVALGSLLLLCSFWLGKPWDSYELVYDAGKTLLFVALLDLFAVRLMRRVSEQRSEIEMLLAGVQDTLVKSGELKAEISTAFQASQIGSVAARVASMSLQVDSIHERLIRAPFDKELDALARPSARGEITPVDAARSFPAAGDAEPEGSR